VASTPARLSHIPSRKRKQGKANRPSINTFSTIAWRTADPFLSAINRRTILQSETKRILIVSITRGFNHRPTTTPADAVHSFVTTPLSRDQLPVRVLCEKLPSFRGARHQPSECPVCCHIRVASRITPHYPRPPENPRLMDRSTYHER
jgi:hypothetical protein